MIFDGNRTVKYEQSGHLFMDTEHMVEIPFLSSAEIKVSISLARQGSTVKAWYLVLRSSLNSGKYYSSGSFTGRSVSLRGLNGKPLKRCL